VGQAPSSSTLAAELCPLKGGYPGKGERQESVKQKPLIITYYSCTSQPRGTRSGVASPPLELPLRLLKSALPSEGFFAHASYKAIEVATRFFFGGGGGQLL
jgi:hypothetical protein